MRERHSYDDPRAWLPPFFRRFPQRLHQQTAGCTHPGAANGPGPRIAEPNHGDRSSFSWSPSFSFRDCPPPKRDWWKPAQRALSMPDVAPLKTRRRQREGTSSFSG